MTQPTLPLDTPDTARLYPDKWLAASALQKAIRRSDADQARAAALMLYQLDKQKLWSRLKVIACEDIGIADLNAVVHTQTLLGDGGFRKSVGQDMSGLLGLVDRLCAAPKSRLANDLCCIPCFAPEYDTDRLSISAMDVGALQETIRYDPDMIRRSIAAFYLAGTARRRMLNMVERAGDPTLLLDVYQQLGVPDAVCNAMRCSLGTSESQALVFGLAWLLVKDSWYVVNDVTQPPKVVIAGYAAEAYDQHTRPGKHAIGQWCKQNARIKSLLDKHFAGYNPVHIMGFALFSTEGMKLLRPMRFDAHDHWLRVAIKSYWRIQNLPDGLARELLALAIQELPHLNDLRATTMRGKI